MLNLCSSCTLDRTGDRETQMTGHGKKHIQVKYKGLFDFGAARLIDWALAKP